MKITISQILYLNPSFMRQRTSEAISMAGAVLLAGCNSLPRPVEPNAPTSAIETHIKQATATALLDANPKNKTGELTPTPPTASTLPNDKAHHAKVDVALGAAMAANGAKSGFIAVEPKIAEARIRSQDLVLRGLVQVEAEFEKEHPKTGGKVTSEHSQPLVMIPTISGGVVLEVPLTRWLTIAGGMAVGGGFLKTVTGSETSHLKGVAVGEADAQAIFHPFHLPVGFAVGGKCTGRFNGDGSTSKTCWGMGSMVFGIGH